MWTKRVLYWKVGFWIRQAEHILLISIIFKVQSSVYLQYYFFLCVWLSLFCLSKHSFVKCKAQSNTYEFSDQYEYRMFGWVIRIYIYKRCPSFSATSSRYAIGSKFCPDCNWDISSKPGWIYIGSHGVQTFCRTLPVRDDNRQKYRTGQVRSSCLLYEHMARWNRFDLYWCTHKWVSWTARVCVALDKIRI